MVFFFCYRALGKEFLQSVCFGILLICVCLTNAMLRLFLGSNLGAVFYQLSKTVQNER